LSVPFYGGSTLLFARKLLENSVLICFKKCFSRSLLPFRTRPKPFLKTMGRKRRAFSYRVSKAGAGRERFLGNVFA
jgi:hypothetical protein